MTRRVVIGNRDGGGGIWVSKSGFDALTATGDNLLLSLSGGTEQIIMTGLASPLPQTVVLGLSQRPYVFITSVSAVPVQFFNGASQVALSGLMRPYPFSSSTGPNSSAVVTASSMTISGGSSSVYYIVVRRAVP